MVVLLLLLFAIALAITVAGLLLSPRSQSSPPSTRTISSPERNRATRQTLDRPIPRRTTEYPAQRSTRQTAEYPASRVHQTKEYPVSRVRQTREYPTKSTTGVDRQSTMQRSAVAQGWRQGNLFNASEYRGQRHRRRSASLSLNQETPWLGVLLILFALLLAGLYGVHTLLPGNSMLLADSWPDAAVAAQPATNTSKAPATITKPAPSFSTLIGAAKALQRIGQLDPAQYNSTADYNTWAYSTCSAAAMTEVINSYGHHYRIADILKVEAGLGEITPDLGLVEAKGIDRTVAQFGFQTYWPPNPTLSGIIQIANSGRPVIVGFPPARWSGGHILVVIGGNSTSVYTADSSRLNMQVFTQANFLKYWGGFAVVVTPK